MGATAPGFVLSEREADAVEYAEFTGSLPAVAPSFESEIDEFAYLSERVADDPDAPAPARYHELCRKYANDGATIGYRHGGPIYMSFGPAWFAALDGAVKGTSNAAHG